MIKNFRAADIHTGACKIGEDLPGRRFFLESFNLVIYIDFSNTIFTGIIYGNQPDGRDGFLLLMDSVKFKDVEISDMVSTYDKEILTIKIPLGVFYAASGSELVFSCT